MRKMHVAVRWLIIIPAIAFALAACTTGQSYEEYLQQWVGAS